MIIGLCGRKEHGKDTFASMLVKAVPSFAPSAFARRLKDACVAVYGLNEAQVSDKIGKEMPLHSPIALDDRLEALRTELGLHNIGPRGLVASTPRQVMQYVGTDYVRDADPDYWLRIVAARFAAEPKGDHVVTDVRFSNEADVIRAAGGRVVKILRLAEELKRTPGQKEHASEALGFDPDYTLAVMEDDFSVPEIVCGFARRGMLLDGLAAFNWDHLSFAAPVAQAYYGDLWPSMHLAAAGMFGEPEKAPA